MSPPSFGAAARILAERDPVIARLVAEAGPPRLSRPTESHFGTLVRCQVIWWQFWASAAWAISESNMRARWDSAPSRSAVDQTKRTSPENLALTNTWTQMRGLRLLLCKNSVEHA